MSNVPLEAVEQRIFVQYLRALRIPFYSVPNSQELSAGQKRKAAMVMAKQKALGLQPGIPDLCIFLPHITVYVEMKRQKGGTVSKVQKHWLSIINKYPYAEAHVCRGADEAIALIESLM